MRYVKIARVAFVMFLALMPCVARADCWSVIQDHIAWIETPPQVDKVNTVDFALVSNAGTLPVYLRHAILNASYMEGSLDVSGWIKTLQGTDKRYYSYQRWGWPPDPTVPFDPGVAIYPFDPDAATTWKLNLFRSSFSTNQTMAQLQRGSTTISIPLQCNGGVLYGFASSSGTKLTEAMYVITLRKNVLDVSVPK